MPKPNLSENLQEIAKQLRCPSGENGYDIAHAMNETNLGMTGETIHALSIQNNDSILELGHGNAKHLSKLFQQEENISYSGLDISPLMHNEAKRINSSFINSGKASFYHYKELPLPFKDQSFSKIFTVNTIYFWSDVELMLKELYRVLKPNGLCCITFIQKDFMATLPFTAYNFEFYTSKIVRDISSRTSFKFLKPINITESIKNNIGEYIQRDYTIVSLIKY